MRKNEESQALTGVQFENNREICLKSDEKKYRIS